MSISTSSNFNYYVNSKQGIIIELRCEYLSIRCTSYHVTYAFQSESTLYSCLNVKKLLAQIRRKIWSLSDRNWTRIHNYLVRKLTHNHLAKLTSLVKWLSVWLRIKWLWIQAQLQSLKIQILHLFRARSSLKFR